RPHDHRGQSPARLEGRREAREPPRLHRPQARRGDAEGRLPRVPGVVGVGPLAGAWRVASAFVEFADTGETRDTLGPNPDGWIVFTDGGRMLGLMTAAGRKDASEVGDFERLFKSMVAYSGSLT